MAKADVTAVSAAFEMLLEEIDEVIDAHGGWPGAFAVPGPDKE